MKQYLLRMPLLLLFAALAVDASAARQTPTTGRVVDPDGTAVAYATVVLLDRRNAVGGYGNRGRRVVLAQSPGRPVPPDDPIPRLRNAHTRRRYAGRSGQFVLHPASVEMQEVVVKTSLVRREADRFVMEIAGSPVALGKDGTELLKQAPGVWLTDDKIAINGASGVKVYINDREVRMSTEQLLNYLRGLKSEEIQRIEVIPQAGADYDADSAAGIIRITLRRQRDNGLTGDLSFSTRQSRQIEGYNPSLSLNGHAGRWTFNVSGWASVVPLHVTKPPNTPNTVRVAHCSTPSLRNAGPRQLRRRTRRRDLRHLRTAQHRRRGRLLHRPRPLAQPLVDRLPRSGAADPQRKPPRRVRGGVNTFSATFNYIWRIDTLGSTLKVMADYSRNNRRHGNDSFVRSTAAGIVRDSTYDDRTRGLYNVAALNAALEKATRRGVAAARRREVHLQRHAQRSALPLPPPRGVETLDAYSYVTDYTEHITAAHAAATLKKGHWNVVAGLRGEYTRTTGYGSDVRQRYFSLFPNANLTYAFDAAGLWSLTAQYARNISRPGFWALNPMRMQISDYTYQSGNPDLLPAYTDNLRSRPSSPESIRSAPAPNSTTTRSRRSSAATPPTHRSPTCVSRTSTARSNTSPRRIFPCNSRSGGRSTPTSRASAAATASPPTHRCERRGPPSPMPRRPSRCRASSSSKPNTTP